MNCTRCEDTKQLWDVMAQGYYPCSCLADQQERGPDAPPIEERFFGPMHDDALRIYAAMLQGIVSRADQRLCEISAETRADLMAKAIGDAFGMRLLMRRFHEAQAKGKGKGK
jgi:hypothetical protein